MEQIVVKILDQQIERIKLDIALTYDHIELKINYALIELLEGIRDNYANSERTRSTNSDDF